MNRRLFWWGYLLALLVVLLTASWPASPDTVVIAQPQALVRSATYSPVQAVGPELAVLTIPDENICEGKDETHKNRACHLAIAKAVDAAVDYPLAGTAVLALWELTNRNFNWGDVMVSYPLAGKSDWAVIRSDRYVSYVGFSADSLYVGVSFDW